MGEVKFVFEGAGLWGGQDDFPYEVTVPRFPVAGDMIHLTDELGRWTVREIEFDYTNGLLSDPIVVVRCALEAISGHSEGEEADHG